MNLWYQTAPLAITDKPADANHITDLRANRPTMIVIHATAGTDSLDWLTTDPRSQVSVHRLIERSGRIYKLADDFTRCNHAGLAKQCFIPHKGSGNVNTRSLGIELENRNDGIQQYTAEQYVACADQCVEWWGRFGYLPIVGHGWIDPRKDDPRAFDWQTFMGLVVAGANVNLVADEFARGLGDG